MAILPGELSATITSLVSGPSEISISRSVVASASGLWRISSVSLTTVDVVGESTVGSSVLTSNTCTLRGPVLVTSSSTHLWACSSSSSE